MTKISYMVRRLHGGKQVIIERDLAWSYPTQDEAVAAIETLCQDGSLSGHEFVIWQLVTYEKPKKQPIHRHYKHRDGETESPTEPGEYWFRGEFGNKHTEGRVLVQLRYSVNGVTEYRVSEHSLHYGIEMYKCNGQWWGPILPPWDDGE